MQTVGQPERITQDRVIKLFKEELGYQYLGNWKDRDNNSPIEEDYLKQYLIRKGYNKTQINKAIHKLNKAAFNYNQGLYTNNKNVYQILRYGADVKEQAGKNYEAVELIDWENWDENDFGIAEEVTVSGQYEKRPDLVLYVNGIALGVIELKRGTGDIGAGIRQNIKNQEDGYIPHFFSTMQLIMAGNDTEGLRYGTIGTPYKYYLSWKEDIEDNSRLQLDKYLLKLCNKQRFLEIIYDFVVFDGGKKKLPRFHQYFGVKAAQNHVHKREGGVIWHTQGSGKSLVMVMLAKWILENNPRARVAVITDRDELDKQIERVFTDVGEKIKRSRSGKELVSQLKQAKPRLFCSLVHKFGQKDSESFNEYIEDLKKDPPRTVGEIFVFVDECHRTQSGKLNTAMKAMLPNAVFIGFTGTPLLKKDKPTSLEVFGKYIHTYKFNEAVDDEIVLDLVYEARDIDQRLSSPEKVDAWFEAKTRGLNDYQVSELKKKWGTLQKVLSSRSRMEKIINDIVFDFSVRPRLNSGGGNAMLVASSIYEACKYYEMLQSTNLKNKCAVVTSYSPSHRNIVLEAMGEDSETDKEFVEHIYQKLLTGYQNTPEKYEEWAREKFIKEPGNMKLLIVVDKLLTGFDAPPCTYLYIDKSMQDHGLFQAICRVNRLDGADKPFGFIIDYMDLFNKVENAIAVYTSELDYDEFDSEDIDIMLEERLNKGKERLDEALEELDRLCEPVELPKEELQYIQYFCGNPEVPEELQSREPQRTMLYKSTVKLLRAYANIADDMEGAGYTPADIQDIKDQMNHYIKLREVIRRASGETIDLKAYEADMRHLIDHYIQADESVKISDFDDLSLLDIIEKAGIDDAIGNMPEGIKKDKEAVAETIENNVRSKIIKEHLVDPSYYDEMSILLDEIIKQRKNKAIDYQEYLKKIADLAKRVKSGKRDDTPDSLDTPAKRRLYNNLNHDEELALRIDKAVKEVKKADFRDDDTKEGEIMEAIWDILQDKDEVYRIFRIIKQQKEY